MIELIDVNKNISNNFFLKEIDLTLRNGEINVLCGPSGAGKTTLLRLINGMEKMDSGDVLVNGKSIHSKSYSRRCLCMDVGMVFQHNYLYSHKNVIDNITLAPRKVKKMNKRDAEELAMSLLDRMGISAISQRYPIQLSGGEQQRVAICRSLAMNPCAMLFDEPTSALDVELKNEIINIISDLAKEGMTILIVTHELNVAERIADQVIFLEQGRVLESGPTKQIIYQPRHERTMEFMRHHHHRDETNSVHRRAPEVQLSVA